MVHVVCLHNPFAKPNSTAVWALWIELGLCARSHCTSRLCVTAEEAKAWNGWPQSYQLNGAAGTCTNPGGLPHLSSYHLLFQLSPGTVCWSIFATIGTIVNKGAFLFSRLSIKVQMA